MVVPTHLIQMRFWKTPNYSVPVVQLIAQAPKEKKKKRCEWADVLSSSELTGRRSTCG